MLHLFLRCHPPAPPHETFPRPPSVQRTQLETLQVSFHLSHCRCLLFHHLSASFQSQLQIDGHAPHHFIAHHSRPRLTLPPYSTTCHISELSTFSPRPFSPSSNPSLLALHQFSPPLPVPRGSLHPPLAPHASSVPTAFLPPWLSQTQPSALCSAFASFLDHQESKLLRTSQSIALSAALITLRPSHARPRCLPPKAR